MARIYAPQSSHCNGLEIPSFLHLQSRQLAHSNKSGISIPIPYNPGPIPESQQEHSFSNGNRKVSLEQISASQRGYTWLNMVHESQKGKESQKMNGPFEIAGKLKELSIHFKKHQKAALTFRTSCTVCGKDNLSEDQLLKHLSEDHYKGSMDLDKDYEVPLKLDQSTKSLNNDDKSFDDSLKEYEKFLGNFVATPGHGEYDVHRLDKRKFKCSFPGCGRTFKRAGHLKRHNVVHVPQTERERHYCEEEGCDKHYSTKYDLAAHRRQAHQGHRLFRCIYRGCCRRFVRRDSLEKHLAVYDHNNRKLDVDSFEFDIHTNIMNQS